MRLISELIVSFPFLPMGDFSLSYLLQNLTESASSENPNDIFLKPYCEAFKEIARFFSFINLGFAFVGSNVRSSCGILIQAQENAKDAPVLYLRDALNYDVQFNGDLLTYSSVTWLHRPLEFIVAMFEDLSGLEDDSMTVTQLSIDNYLNTMGKFHSWPVQQMTKLLFYTLPDWGNLRRVTMQTDREETSRLMKEIIPIGKNVYERTAKMLQEFHLYHPANDGLNDKSDLEMEID